MSIVNIDLTEKKLNKDDLKERCYISTIYKGF